jgi:hypothetical protein
MPRPRHPDKHIEEAVAFAERNGWTVEISNGHAWGRIYCPHANRDGCKLSVSSTPHNPQGHARRIIREINKCPH